MSGTDHSAGRLDTGGTGRWISFGIATYLVLGLGTAISVFLVGLFGSVLSAGPGGAFPGTGGLLGDSAVSGALLMGLLVITFLGAAVATGLLVL